MVKVFFLSEYVVLYKVWVLLNIVMDLQKKLTFSNFLQVSLSDIFYDLYLDFCPSQSNEDLESPNYSDDDSDDPEVDDVDEQVTKIMRDPPIKLVAMQPPPSISMICDTRPVYR